NCDLTGLSHVTTAHSTYNGPTNTFTKQGSGNSSCVGGNTFDAGSTNTFYNYGTGYFRLANSVPDDMNGIARYQQHGSGALLPAYGTACTYSNNISTVATLTAIQFGVGGGTVVLDGTNQTINGEAVQPPLFYRLNLSHSGTLTLLTPTAVRNTFTMNSGLTNLNGNTLTLGISTGTPGTLSYTAGWCYGGTLTRWLNNTAIAVGGVNGHFPMGSSTTDYRPLWFGSTVNLTAGGTLSVQHSPTTSGSNAASHADASWGNTVLGVSNAAWTITRANGLTVNGSTARLRYGGTGFDPFVLTDLNASLASSVVGTFAAATSTVVPLEVNRTALNSAAVGNTWMIGTRNLSQSPLPVELLYFTATPSGPDVLLAWATATEHNNDHFVVERSPNAEDWEAIAMLSGAGNSLSTLTYSHRDNDPLPGTSYYRLQQVDHDGTSTFSQAVSVRMNSPRTVTAFPNPTTGLIHIAGLSATESIALTDMKGGVQKVPIERDGNVITLDGRDLAAGIYQVLTAAGALRVSISP
ncbi:MAG: T9SS type A sorting domain-containing protein, partial [Flavobacteriales bacterium]|nr:T9SS type A sorting domain-containing protein [Flavobacteriales bacterium]